MALGTGIALLPESSFAFVTAKVPAGAVPTSVLVLSLLGGGLSTSAHAQYAAVPGDADMTPEQQTIETDTVSESPRATNTPGTA